MGSIDEAADTEAGHGGTPIFAAIREELGFSQPQQNTDGDSAGTDSSGQEDGADDEAGPEEPGRHRGA